MSNTQYAFLSKSHVPSRNALQAAIDSLDLPLQLHPDFAEFEDSGFSPCTLLGREGPGFEIFYESASEVVADDESFQAIAGKNDYCISLVWHSSQEDFACVMIVCAALATSFGAVVSYEGEDPEAAESLLQQARDILQEVSTLAESIQPEPAPVEAPSSEPRTVKLTIGGLPGGKTLTRTYKGGKREA